MYNSKKALPNWMQLDYNNTDVHSFFLEILWNKQFQFQVSKSSILEFWDSHFDSHCKCHSSFFYPHLFGRRIGSIMSIILSRRFALTKSQRFKLSWKMSSMGLFQWTSRIIIYCNYKHRHILIPCFPYHTLQVHITYIAVGIIS